MFYMLKKKWQMVALFINKSVWKVHRIKIAVVASFAWGYLADVLLFSGVDAMLSKESFE